MRKLYFKDVETGLMADANLIKKKTILIGDSGIGKTALIDVLRHGYKNECLYVDADTLDIDPDLRIVCKSIEEKKGRLILIDDGDLVLKNKELVNVINNDNDNYYIIACRKHILRSTTIANYAIVRNNADTLTLQYVGG